MSLRARPDVDGAWLAPAKLNLMLRVIGRRADGYHRLQTVFQFIDHCDRLFFEPRADGRIERASGVDGLPFEQDLVVRAALALKAASGSAMGVTIRVDKRLPMGAGLGGGSSDAATTLHALNRLWHLGLSDQRLAAIGLALGADVPVFINGEAAWAEGVGETLSRVELPTPWYLVLVPPCQVSTAVVFNHPQLTRDSVPITLADFVRGETRNDCLTTVLAEYPEVRDAYRWLAERSEAKLTGTGACVFAAMPSYEAARRLAEQVPPGLPSFVAKGCNRSPLFADKPSQD